MLSGGTEIVIKVIFTATVMVTHLCLLKLKMTLYVHVHMDLVLTCDWRIGIEGTTPYLIILRLFIGEGCINAEVAVAIICELYHWKYTSIICLFLTQKRYKVYSLVKTPQYLPLWIHPMNINHRTPPTLSILLCNLYFLNTERYFHFVQNKHKYCYIQALGFKL